MKKSCIVIGSVSSIVTVIVIVDGIIILPTFLLLAQDATRENIVSSVDETDYSMDSRTILRSLAEGKTDVFIEQMATPSVTPVKLPPVQWKQADYLKVADAFSKAIFHESLDGWKVKDDIHFSLDCKDVSFGPQYASIMFFKSISSGKDTSRIERTIAVDPQENQVSWSGATFSPDTGGATPVDLSRVNFSVDEALRIAEANGGEKFRLGVNNDCGIDITNWRSMFQATFGGNDWKAWYEGSQGELFNINVNQQTGNYQIIYPKPK